MNAKILACTSLFTLTYLLTSTASAQSYALELGADCELTFPHDPIMNTGERVTMELWYRAEANATGVVYLERYQGSVEHKSLALLPDGTASVIYAGSPWKSGGVNTPAGALPMDQQWHHVAFVRHQDGTYELYVDGIAVLTGGPGPCWLTCGIINGTPSTTIKGATSQGSVCSGWQLDEVRWSTIDRYNGPFTPQTDFVSDAETALLLHFDEGFGSVVNDSGPAAQVGALSGAYAWVGEGDPNVYCTAKTNSAGCLPSIGWTGSPTLSGADDFVTTAVNVLNNKVGLFFWGQAPHSAPLFGGTLCITSQIQRGQPLGSGGSPAGVDCTGVFQNAFTQSLMASKGYTAGTILYGQFWYRDPGFASPNDVGLTDALQFTILD